MICGILLLNRPATAAGEELRYMAARKSTSEHERREHGDATEAEIGHSVLDFFYSWLSRSDVFGRHEGFVVTAEGRQVAESVLCLVRIHDACNLVICQSDEPVL